MHKKIYFSRKKMIKKMCAYPTEDFQTCYLKHTYFFLWPKIFLTRTLILPMSFCPENVLYFFTSTAYIQVHIRIEFVSLEANTMNPDQLPKNTSRWESRQQKSWLAGQGLIIMKSYHWQITHKVLKVWAYNNP